MNPYAWSYAFIYISEMKMNIVDAQNACLSGGVAVGAIADLSLQPYGAVVIGSVVGIISTVGYQVIQVQSNLNKKCILPKAHLSLIILTSLRSIRIKVHSYISFIR